MCTCCLPNNISNCCVFLLQLACLISQSVVLGFLTEYFGITEPTAEETRNAYLYAAGNLLKSDCF